MQGSSNDNPQQWAVHAHFTISHPGMDDPNSNQQAQADRDENGVHMSYSWSTPSAAQETASSDNKLQPSYGFQKGNLLFTSIPPRRSFTTNSNPDGHLLNVARNVEDSGYTSTLLSPSSCASHLYPRRPMQMCNHKCKSSCSIVLSTTIDEQPELEDPDSVSQCSRSQSLRCQTSSIRHDKPVAYYGCGDPWCHHATYNETGPFSPTQGSETSCSTGQTVVHRPTQEIKKIPNIEERKDAAVQTFEMVDKCTSPFMMVDSFYLKKQDSQDSLKRDKSKKRFYGGRSRTEPITMRSNSPSSFTPDSLERYEPRKRLVRQSATKFPDKSTLLSNTKTSLTESSDSTKKPRTVHIDVYCTGTEQESEGSSSEIESKPTSTPQTVFESEKVRITHSRSDDKDLPIKLKSKVLELKPENDSDDDNTSTAYPSQISSYSAIGGLSSFGSSVPPSWSAYSVSVDNDYDSVANTSWKDTFSDFDSVNRSRSSIALTDSLDFVPRRLAYSQKSESIEEQPELDVAKKAGTPSTVSLNPSDSFEYANSEDKFRINRMEEMWNKPNKHWKSPQLERKHLLQQQKLKEYVEKRLKGVVLPKQESRESDSESDSSEKGWSVVKNNKNATDVANKNNRFVPVKEEKEPDNPVSHRLTVPGPFQSRRSPTSRSPSILALQQKLTLNPTLRSPFMIVPGIFTDQRSVAKKFGSIVEVYKKPGHHIGPAKNPECQCDHCRSYFEHIGRGRTRSLGEGSDLPWTNWRRSSRCSQSKEPKDA